MHPRSPTMRHEATKIRVTLDSKVFLSAARYGGSSGINEVRATGKGRRLELLERERRVEDGDVRVWDVAVGLGATRLVLYLLSK
jgi:hypothetical protein